MNNTNLLLSILIALIIGGGIGYAIASNTNTQSQRTDDTIYPEMQGGMHQGMGHGMHMQGGMMGMSSITSERDFIEEMIPHHQEAVDTAREVLARGATTDEVRTLVTGIITAQEAEIAEMKAWYQAWYGKPYADSGEYQPMMRDLSPLSGEAIDRAFMQDMIMHHMMAIMMAHQVEPYIEHDEMEELVENVISTQSDEIQMMRGLLRNR